jgi:hypothetical protein
MPLAHALLSAYSRYCSSNISWTSSELPTTPVSALILLLCVFGFSVLSRNILDKGVLDSKVLASLKAS